MQNSDFSTWIASLHGSQPPSVVFGCKTAWFAPEWHDYIVSSHHLWFCAYKTAPLGLELQVSVGQRPHLCFFHWKQRLYDQTYKSLWVPALTCGFCMQISDFWCRITSLYGSQTCPAALCMYNSGLNIRITSLYGTQPSSEVFSTHNIVLSTRINILYWFQPSSVCFFSCKTATLWPDLQVCMGPRSHLWVWAQITACLAQE